MKMKKLFFLIAASLFVLTAFVSKKDTKITANYKEEGGIAFENISLDEAMKMAKKSGKIIFIDAYTSWCGPCKKMAATSFMDENVASFYNSKFINLKIEMEKSADGPKVARMYGVKAYPTLLFIDGDGILKKSVIGFQTSSQLISTGKSL
jgi:thiol:disulfide interchange protein